MVVDSGSGADPKQVSMADLITYGRWLAAAETLLIVGLLIVMARRGLIRNYPIFFVIMAFQPVGRIIFLFLNPGKNSYAYFYLARTPIFWILSVLVVYELYKNVLADFPGILSLGKWIMAGTFVLAVFSSVLTARYDWNV